MAEEINQDQFDEAVLQSEKPVLVDFYATWCPPCKMLAPVVERLSNEWKDRLEVVKVNTDEAPDLASQYNVSSVPTMIVFKDGKKEKVMVGHRDFDSLTDELEAVV